MKRMIRVGMLLGVTLASAGARAELPAVKELAPLRREVQPAALRLMIADLRAAFPRQFTRADEFLAGVAEHERQLAAVDAVLAGAPGPAELAQARERIMAARQFQREIARANPLLNAHPLLFVVRPQYARDHHNTETLFHTGEPNNDRYRPGGALKLWHPATDTVTVVLDAGSAGSLRDPEVHCDGRRIIFAMRRNKNENYSIYELAVDPAAGYSMTPGSLRRLTAEPEATDIDPLYLPDGRIIFSSTREPKYCHCNMHIMANLHRMDGDGANIHQISKNTLFDGHPTLLPDGRVLYYRWEYVDRNFGDAQGLWTVNPDGTNHALYWGNNVPSPDAVFDARIIPGTDSVVCIFGACHDRPWGAMAIINRNKGIDVPEAIERLWPESSRTLLSFKNEFVIDRWFQMDVRYEDPYPLTSLTKGVGGKYFLVSRTIKAFPKIGMFDYSAHTKVADEMGIGIYLMDIFGNEILLHGEAPGCFDPQPLSPRFRPPIIPDRRDFVSSTGTMYVGDVYIGTHMTGVERGEIMALRVVESREKRFWTGPTWNTLQFVTPGGGYGGTLNKPAISWAGFETKQILGTVPVEPDGSAYFELPAERFVYFQLLDRNGQLVQTMRSGTLVQPGERQGCIGCHESRLSAWNPPRPLQALARPPSRLDGGSDSPFNYLKEVQPIWDRHCVSCHDFGKPAGKKIVLARDKEIVFNVSYVELFQNWGKKEALVNTVGLGLAPILEPRSVGSHQSRLVKLLLDGHHNVKLSAEELQRIVTWIDIGGPYYPDYASARINHPAGRSPLTQKQLLELQELTGADIVNKHGWLAGAPTHRVWVSFDRPESSPCLQKLDTTSDAYQQALAIIQAGQEEVRQRPDADMPDFIPDREHQRREEKYQRLAAREAARRAALREGREVYDPGRGGSGHPETGVRCYSGEAQ